MGTFAKLLFSLVAVYAVFVVLIFLGQRQLMYFPFKERIAPDQIGLSGVDEIVLELGNDEQSFSWYGPALDGQPTILFFHGNAGSVGYRADRFVDFMASGYGLFMLGYPGYGGSDGRPTEAAFTRASRTAYDYLLARGVAPGDIVIYGESIGSGVAVQLAANVDARALILEAPMSSAAEVAAIHYPYLPVKALIRDSWSSIDYIERVNMPLLAIHGTNDRIIPISSGRELFDKAPGPKQFVPVEGAGHNDLPMYPVVEFVRGFLGQ
ncbi:MAG: alpha/beta hydrolase [Woeseiaceae bacterium]